MWRLDNSVGTFFACSDTAPPPRRYVRDLRQELRYAASPDENSPEASDGSGITQDSRAVSKQTMNASASKDSSRGGASVRQQGTVRQYVATTSFERVWWDKGGDTKKHATIWRPQPPTGYCILGDTACEGWVALFYPLQSSLYEPYLGSGIRVLVYKAGSLFTT